MANIPIQIKRGNKSQIDASSFLSGEMVFSTDTNQVFVSDGSSEILVGRPSLNTLASRPPASIPGQLFYATDTDELFIDTGSSWESLTFSASDDHSWSSTQNFVNATVIAGTINGNDPAGYLELSGDPSTSNYLRLDDGGNVTIQGGGAFLKNNDTGYIAGIGGSAYGRGASFFLYGEDHASAPGKSIFDFGDLDNTGARKGSFVIRELYNNLGTEVVNIAAGRVLITATSNDASTDGLVINDVDGVEVFAVDSDGNVESKKVIVNSLDVNRGSGTANTGSDDLVIGGTDKAGVGLSILTNNTSAGTIVFGDSDDNTRGYIQYSHSNDRMNIGSDGVMVVSAPRILLGTTTDNSSDKLQVEGSILADSLRLDNSSTNIVPIEVAKADAETIYMSWNIYHDGTNYRLREAGEGSLIGQNSSGGFFTWAALNGAADSIASFYGAEIYCGGLSLMGSSSTIKRDNDTGYLLISGDDSSDGPLVALHGPSFGTDPGIHKAIFGHSGNTGSRIGSFDVREYYNSTDTVHMRVHAGGGVTIGTTNNPTNREQLLVEGAVELDELSSSPTHDSGYGKIYVKTDKKIYYKDSSGTETDLTSGGTSELEITQWTEDDTSPTSNATLWGAQSVLRFGSSEDHAVWFSFEMPDYFSDSSDINFRLNYSVTTDGTSGDSISLNLIYCVVSDGETPDFGTPDATKEDEIDVGSIVGNQSNYLDLTNIKIDSSDIPSGNSRVIGKLWRDIDGASQNYSNSFDLISLIAKQ